MKEETTNQVPLFIHSKEATPMEVVTMEAMEEATTEVTEEEITMDPTKEEWHLQTIKFQLEMEV